MALEPWDIDRLPKTAISDIGMPESDAEWKTWEEAQRAINTHMGETFEGGKSEYDPSVWMMGKHAPSHEKYHRPESESSGSGYHMPGITHPEDDEDFDDEESREPSHYHVMTGHADSTDPSEWTEHEYTMFEHPHSDYDTDSAWDYFQQDHPEFNPERNPSATHEVKNVHPAEHHDTWHNMLRSEDEDFSRIFQHGFQRESPDTPGHRAYTHTDPHGGVHRLWHNHTNFVNEGPNRDQTHGPGWRTSYHVPGMPQERQMPWHFHDDDTHTGDSLGDALTRVERNKAHADVVHSETGLRPVENAYGRHYVSKRPGGSTQQLLFNSRGGQGENNWSLTHYSPDTTDMNTTEHGEDLAGALEQARRNLARG